MYLRSQLGLTSTGFLLFSSAFHIDVPFLLELTNKQMKNSFNTRSKDPKSNGDGRFYRLRVEKSPYRFYDL